MFNHYNDGNRYILVIHGQWAGKEIKKWIWRDLKTVLKEGHNITCKLRISEKKNGDFNGGATIVIMHSNDSLRISSNFTIKGMEEFRRG